MTYGPIEEVVARAGVDLQVSSIRPTVACPALGRAAVPPEPAGGAGGWRRCLPTAPTSLAYVGVRRLRYSQQPFPRRDPRFGHP